MVEEESAEANPEVLSIANLQLAKANSQLGRVAAKAKYFARMAERTYKANREKLKLKYADYGMSLGKAESKAYLESELLFEAYNNLQLMADGADDLCYRTDTMLKMSQSRLSLIKGDIKNGSS